MAAQWTLEDLYQSVVKSWYVLVGTVVAFVVASIGLFFVYPQTYTAEAQHTVEPISVLAQGSSFNTVNMETERVIATSTGVLQRAADALDDVSVNELRESVVIEVPRNSQVLIFQVTAGSGNAAAEQANVLATAYGEQRIENARVVVDQTAEELSGAITQMQELLATQESGSNAYAATQLELQALLDQQAQLTSTPLFSGILVTSAEAPQSSNRPSVLVFVAAGLFLGLLFGGIAALVASRAREGRPTGDGDAEGSPTRGTGERRETRSRRHVEGRPSSAP